MLARFDIEGISINLISSLIAFTVGFFSRHFAFYWRMQRPANKVLAITNERDIHIIVGDGPSDQPRLYPAMHEADVLAANAVAENMVRLMPNSRVKICSSVQFTNQASIEDNLVIIGGPANNRIFRIIAERSALPYRFECFEDHAVLIDPTNTRHIQRLDADMSTIQDFGILALMNNPFEESSRVIIIAGCGTLGTASIAQVLSPPQVNQLARLLPQRPKRCIVYEIENLDGFVTKPKVVTVGTL
jgi:hypothetical protein